MNARQGFIGQAVERREDSRFLTGQGQYTDDITLHGQTYAYFLRSPYAHARILSLKTAAAESAPGVVGVFTESISKLWVACPVAGSSTASTALP